MSEGLRQRETSQRRIAREERELPKERLNRTWLLLNTAQWTRSDETTANPDLWSAFSSPASKRRGTGREFASAVGALVGVTGIWITNTTDDLAVAIALDDLELESQVRETFIDLVCEELDPSEGELFVFPSDQVPEWVLRGESLI